MTQIHAAGKCRACSIDVVEREPLCTEPELPHWGYSTQIGVALEVAAMMVTGAAAAAAGEGSMMQEMMRDDDANEAALCSIPCTIMKTATPPKN